MREMTGLCALDAKLIGHLELITVGFVRGALGEWITIARGMFT